MTQQNVPLTIAGIQLRKGEDYDADLDTDSEVELVTRLRTLPLAEFVDGMNHLLAYLNSLPPAIIADRYATLLVKMAGGEPAESMEAKLVD